MSEGYKSGRRKFLQRSGLALGFVTSQSLLEPFARAETATRPRVAVKSDRTLYNPNVQTAIGLGDQTPGIVDRHGQLDSRHAKVRLEFSAPPQSMTDAQWIQTLYGGYLPAVDTEVLTKTGSARWSMAAQEDSVAGEWLEVTRADWPTRVHLWFPQAMSIAVRDGIVTSNDQVLAVFPNRAHVQTSQAKYNLLTPTRDTWSLSQSPWAPLFDPLSHSRRLSDVDAAFRSGRASFLFRPLHYRFPVEIGRTYCVILGLIVPEPEALPPDGPNPAKSLLRLSVDGNAVTVNMDDLVPGHPFLQKFLVRSTTSDISVKSETDPSSTSPYRPALLNGVWIYDTEVDLEQVKAGDLSRQALFYVRCGEELIEDMACRVTLDYPSIGHCTRCRIHLPYQERMGKEGGISALPDRRTLLGRVKQRWDQVLASGAEFVTGDPKLDALYKTSLINIFLLRSKVPDAARQGRELYLVKPGATIYNAFWYRDAGYITAALNVAGHTDEAEKSLRLFWQRDLPRDCASFGQQESGAWQVPIGEYDGQGQALWALVHHFQLTGDLEWLRSVYPAVRRGAEWIRDVTEQLRFTNENGERPIYFGLLPSGEGEAIGGGYNYYHDYWAAYGLRMAIRAAEVLREEQDVRWMMQTHQRFSADLRASIKLAFERVGGSQYIPATPYNSVSQFDIWGSIAALYPTRFLDRDDPMMTRTLEFMNRASRENVYTYFSKGKIWTYITADWAMCYLLRGDLATFSRLLDGFVDHASPTNGWIEEIFLDSRLGTGDMPHGWAAAQYVYLQRNALVCEDEDTLQLCWGVREAWLDKGVAARRAPTRFGTVDLNLRKRGDELVLDWKLTRGHNQETCRRVRLHLPRSASRTSAVRVNGTPRALGPRQTVIDLE